MASKWPAGLAGMALIWLIDGLRIVVARAHGYPASRQDMAPWA